MTTKLTAQCSKFERDWADMRAAQYFRSDLGVRECYWHAATKGLVPESTRKSNRSSWFRSSVT